MGQADSGPDSLAPFHICTVEEAAAGQVKQDSILKGLVKPDKFGPQWKSAVESSAPLIFLHPWILQLQYIDTRMRPTFFRPIPGLLGA